MSNLEQALRLNLFEEMELIPTESKEEFIHSENYNRQINRLFDKMRGDKYHRFTKKATTIILVAAILFALVVAGFAATIGRDFVIKTFSDHLEYSVTDKTNSKIVNDLQVGYVPDGFILENEELFKNYCYKAYSSNDRHFSITKGLISGEYSFDLSDSKEIISINGVKYFYIEIEGLREYVWNDGNYNYKIKGNLGKDDLLTIAQSIS